MPAKALGDDNPQLKAELEGLRGILASVGSYVYTKDLNSCYTYVNAPTCELFGAPFEDIVGSDDSRFFDPDIVAQLQANDRQVVQTGLAQVHQERLVLKPSGEIKQYLAVKAPMYDAQGQVIGICGVSTDITAQKQLEVQLQESHQLLNTILNNVDANIYMKDAQGRYLYANQRVLDTVHMARDQLLGRTDADLFPVKLADAYQRVDQRVFTTGETQRAEEEYESSAGKKTQYWSTKLLLQREHQPDALIGFSTEITSLRHADRAVTRSEARFRALFEASSEAVVVISTERFLDCNAAALTLMGLQTKAEFLQLNPADLSPPEQTCGTASHLLAQEFIGHAFRDGHRQFEWILRRRDNGADIPVEAIATAIDLDDGPALLVTLRDQTERKLYEEKINQLAYYDALTQLPNRRLLYDRLSQTLGQLRRSQQHGCVIYLDLDNFKPLNDQHGHLAGDQLLQEVGQRLMACLRAQDTVARLGGDEFVTLLTELSPSRDMAIRQAAHVAEKILATLSRPFVLSVAQNEGASKSVVHQCTASLGVVVFHAADTNIDNLLRRADDAMYKAKASGRNQYCHGDEASG